jgi:outer membrane protein TolC
MVLLVTLLAPQILGIDDAIERARKLYPAVQVSRSQVDAAAAGILRARTSYLPRLDSIAQVNRATRNNIYGMLLQQSVISPISGPPVSENSATSVFGTAAGLLIDWEPFDFGLRKSKVDLAESTRRRTEASVARTQFEAEAAAADAYVTILAAQETVKAANASIERSRVLLTAVDALVRAELRPGADAAIARSELASAQAQAIRGRQAVADAKALLAGFTGEQPANIAVTEGKMLTLPEETPDTPAPLAENPFAREQTAAIDEAKARLHTLDRQWVPRFSVQGTTYARGTTGVPDYPALYNWGLGFSVKFPLLDQASVRAQQAEQSAHVRTEESRYKLVLNELETRRNRALAALAASRELAQLAPVQLESARAAQAQAQARYKAGLATVVEVADTQRTLSQAEIDDGLAKLNVWRALLAVYSAEGDLGPFVRKAAR